jgi:hypothetical protein
MGSAGTLYKIRCVATIYYNADRRPPTGLAATGYRGWFIVEEREGVGCFHDPLKTFQALHKQLKSSVSHRKSSGTAGSRLVGAATLHCYEITI